MPVSPALILASASQRRQQFLRDLEVPFSIQVSAIDESPLPGEEAAAMTQRLAEAKAWAAARLVEERSPHAPIVASDTTVALDGVLYGKPAEAAEAAQMLRALRGQRPCRDQRCDRAAPPRPPGWLTRVNQSIVTMRAYTDREIDAYVQSGDPLDKAGAYGIQSAPFAPVCARAGLLCRCHGASPRRFVCVVGSVSGCRSRTCRGRLSADQPVRLLRLRTCCCQAARNSPRKGRFRTIALHMVK
jgi:septum formation protein